MTACPIRYQRQVPDRKGKIFYTSITSLSHVSKITRIIFYTIFAKIFRAYYFRSGIIGRTISPK